MTVPDFTEHVTPFLTSAHIDFARNAARAAEALVLEDHDATHALDRLRASALFALLVPPSDKAIDVRALCLTREALAYRSPLADSIFAVQGLGSHPLVMAKAKPEVLAHIMTGKAVGAFALTEPEAGSDVGSMRTTATRDGASWKLDGEKVFISNVGIATHYIVFARVTDPNVKKPISAFFVPADAKGLTLEKIAMSLDHPLGKLIMRGCTLPEDALLGNVGDGMRLALGTLDVFRTSVGAAACGMARRALDETVAHVKQRVQFGKPLADFQLTQAAIAEMATDLDAARLLVYRAAYAKDAGQTARVEVAMAKLFATEAAQRIIDRAVQLFGGLGVALGTPVEQLYREIRPLRIYEGTSEIQKLIIGGALVS